MENYMKQLAETRVSYNVLRESRTNVQALPQQTQFSENSATLTHKRVEAKNLNVIQEGLRSKIDSQDLEISEIKIDLEYILSKAKKLLDNNVSLASEKRAVEQDIANIGSMSESLKDELAKVYNNIVLFRRSNEIEASKLRGVEAAIEDCLQNNNDLSSEINGIELELQKVNAKVLDAKDSLRCKDINWVNHETVYKSMQRQIGELKKRIHDENIADKELRCATIEINNKIAALRQDAADNDFKSKNYQLHNDEIREVNSMLRRDLEAVKQHMKCLQAVNSRLRNSLEEFEVSDTKIARLVLKDLRKL